MRNIFTLLLFCLCAGSLYSQQYDWKVVGQMNEPVWGAQAINNSLSGKNLFIYLLGGYSYSEQDTVDWIQECNVPYNIWKTIGHMKSTRQNFVAGIWKSKIIYFGGNSRFENEKDNMELLEFNSDYLTPSIFSKDSNFARSSSTGYVYNNNLYIVGGDPTDGSPYKSLPFITEYNLDQKKVSYTFDTTSLRPGNNMSLIKGDNIYIFGGVINQDQLSRSISKFNITTKKYEVLSATLPESRVEGAAIYNPYLDKGFIIGGLNEHLKPLSTVWEITFNDDGSLTIGDFSPLKYARRGCMAVNYNNFIAVLGGKDAGGVVVPEIEILDTVTTTSVSKNISQSYSLSQNYPNPFNPNTTIYYSVNKLSFVTLKVFDILGREVSTLVNEMKSPGSYEVSFDADKILKYGIKSGIYFYRLISGNYSETKKMILLK